MPVYHEGSRALQDRVGVRETADHVGRAIGDGIKPVAAAFLELQPLLVLGAADPETARVWASPVTGAPGFARATTPHQMSVTGRVRPGDPLAPALATEGVRIGTIALDPRTRRRMRLNGRLRPTPRGLAISADRVFSNCPKYIQRRQSYEVVADRGAKDPRRGTELTAHQRRFIASADTFFIATVHEEGADVSHRGGNPGFVRVDSPRALSWRDYPGNSMFLTLGNIRSDSRAGLLFLDWTTGTTLQLTGEARTLFGADGARRVRFELTEATETPSALPLRWSEPEYSPANPVPAD
ncbi:pyridoxamine 5'-phosphate oxidase family protein [Streptomyces cylindrosporus]|uniref:Pyridoxamine 5'-phosphate oxidase family protein n=1 Tax=Streptomyces cylindrosporus TaxID=2927583 RepID=A0ABS9Y0T9_9ACTN|nr:pyridoxamine 5'-phosphate oxidase family protein [Streptomyces cylindrosporus]MCI3269596.1 pyridoxamine 5'-phosphate oxidase family protein [Streptomyces cylindrosporus]